jgi:hypothetical protein
MLEKFHRVTSDMLRLLLATQPQTGGGDVSVVEEEINLTGAQLSRLEVDDKVNETNTQEVCLLAK